MGNEDMDDLHLYVTTHTHFISIKIACSVVTRRLRHVFKYRSHNFIISLNDI